ncbi:MAG: hypothetical protein R6V17_05750 [Halanaerobacter sp.]
MSKDLLLGVGIALIITSSILMVTDSDSYEDKQLAQEEITKKARKVGMVFPGEDTKTTEQNKFSLQRKTTLKSTDSSSPSSASSPQVTIEIPPGVSSREVANLLHKNNLIQDEKSFIKLLTKFNLANKIMAGSYQFRTDISPSELLLSLTTN